MGLFDTIANLASSSSQTNAGSTQGGSNSAYNFSNGASFGDADSWSYSRTFGSEATAKSYAEALRAHQREQEFYDQAMAYNAQEAEKQRYFNALMGSTVYQRSIDDMKKAGINPVLAASFGLSAGQVNSGQAASVSTPQTYMGQTFADQISASASKSHNESWNHSEGASEGSTWGSSWQNSTSGLSTFLDQMNLTVNGLKDMINGGSIVAAAEDWANNTLPDTSIDKEGSEYAGHKVGYDNSLNKISRGLKNTVQEVKDLINTYATNISIGKRANEKRNDGAYDSHYYDANYY